MTQSILTLSFFTLLVLNLSAQWELINIDLENNSSNYHVDFKDEQFGIILKGTNQFIKTEDGGSTWDTVLTEAFTLIDFEYLVGDTIIGIGRTDNGSGLYWSYDNGDHWNQELLLADELFSDFTKHGDTILIGAKKKIIRYNLSNAVHEEVYSLPDNNYSLIGNVQELFQTSDSIIYASAVALSDVDSLFKDLVLKSTDAGTNWNIISTHNDRFLSAPKLHFWNDSLGFYIVENPSSDFLNSMYKTSDGGNSWTEEVFDFHGQYIDVSFPSDSVGFISAGGVLFGFSSLFYSFSILKTMDMGQTWEYQYLNQAGAPILGLDFMTDSLGFVVGEFDLIMKTNTCGGEIDEDYPFSYFIVATDEVSAQDDIKVYPNPTADVVTLALSSDNTLYDFELNVYTSNGALVLKQNYVQQNAVSIDLSSIQSALLLLEVKTDRATYIKKVIKR